MASNADYVMGISDAEFERLRLQGRYLEPVTRRLIREAGIGPGMRVLDIGGGVGEVSRLLAEAVGASGQVVAVDREPRAIARARDREPQPGNGPIEYVLATDEEMAALGPFDAAIGRYILFHQADPIEMVRRAAAAVRPGGIVVFEEMVTGGGCQAIPPIELWTRLVDAAFAVVQVALPSPNAGRQLLSLLQGASLQSPRVYEERIKGDWQSLMIPWLVMSCQTVLPLMERFGVAEPDVGDFETLPARLAEAARRTGSEFISGPEACGWAIRP